jgi:hypothetical protein
MTYYSHPSIHSLIHSFIHITFAPCGAQGIRETLRFHFNFLILQTDCRTPWTGHQPVARPLPTVRKTQTQNKRRQTSMSRVGFEPTIPAFERAKTIYDLDRAATAIFTYYSTVL